MQDHVVQEAKLISNLCYQIRDYAVSNHLNVNDTIQRIGDDLKDFSKMSAYDGKKGSFINRR
jgi:hypothetical protein